MIPLLSKPQPSHYIHYAILAKLKGTVKSKIKLLR
jgi:hypothetical protein